MLYNDSHELYELMSFLFFFLLNYSFDYGYRTDITQHNCVIIQCGMYHYTSVMQWLYYCNCRFVLSHVLYIYMYVTTHATRFQVFHFLNSVDNHMIMCHIIKWVEASIFSLLRIWKNYVSNTIQCLESCNFLLGTSKAMQLPGNFC
jgi:hypothetical protein